MLISLIFVSKILHLINARITPIIKRHLSDSQLGFKKAEEQEKPFFSSKRY